MARPTKKLLKAISLREKAVKDMDLYRCLHNVGDDEVKSFIEEVLKQVLPPETYAKVVAVFLIAVEE